MNFFFCALKTNGLNAQSVISSNPPIPLESGRGVLKTQLNVSIKFS